MFRFHINLPAMNTRKPSKAIIPSLIAAPEYPFSSQIETFLIVSFPERSINTMPLAIPATGTSDRQSPAWPVFSFDHPIAKTTAPRKVETMLTARNPPVPSPSAGASETVQRPERSVHAMPIAMKVTPTYESSDRCFPSGSGMGAKPLDMGASRCARAEENIQGTIPNSVAHGSCAMPVAGSRSGDSGDRP